MTVKRRKRQNQPHEAGKVYHLPHLDDGITKEITHKLEEMRRESEQIIKTHMHQDLEPQREGAGVGDDMDIAADERERELGLLLHQRHLRRIQQVDDALERMGEGTYGLCEGTEEPIRPERLVIMPLTRYSLEYQQQQERTQGRGYRFNDNDGMLSTDDN